jgi:eukaryotic-like serine/threonine-protein kinase
MDCEFCGNALVNLDGDLTTSYFRLKLSSGTLLKSGLYLIKSTLGEGGFAIAYSATHRTSNKNVAIKGNSSRGLS